ncbi:MAG: heme exporter protein CcmD [Parashewanella sp.]
MQFDSLQDFFNMGGYAFFVWCSYGISLTSLFILIFMSCKKEGKLLKQLKQKLEREQRLKQVRSKQHESKT